MKISKYLAVLVLPAMSVSLQAAEADATLSLQEAERIAIKRDLILQSQQASHQAMQEQSIAADNWPDPVIKFGALAVPVDTYDLEQEQMTQVVLGYKQMLPRGNTAKIKSKKWLAKAGLVDANRSLRKAMLVKAVRKAWFRVYLQERTRDVVKTNTRLFQQLVKVSQSQYVAGRKKQQDVLQAEVELSLVEDQLEKVEAELEVARAAFAKWVGHDVAQRKLNAISDFLGGLMLTEQQMTVQMLNAHPRIAQSNAMIDVAEKDVSLADEKTNAQWGFDISYGLRQGDNPAMAGGGERPDFLSMMATVSIPVFSNDKNDRVIAASQQKLQEKKYRRQDVLRELHSQLNQAKARWYKTIERISRYKEKVLPQAKQNAKAAMSAYQSGVGSFVALTRARVSEFKAQLSHIKLVVEKANVLAEIRYLVGEES